jgi:hypothetical protein
MLEKKWTSISILEGGEMFLWWGVPYELSYIEVLIF